MKKFILLIVPILILALLSSCRPPELEGAFVDFNAGRFDNALKLAEEATQKYPDNAEAWFLLGKIYAKKERFKEMRHAFDKSLSLSKQFEPQIKNLTMYHFQNLFNRGVSNYNAFVKMEDRQSEKAKKLLENAVNSFRMANIVKPDYRAIDLMALSYSLGGMKDSALVYYNKLVEMAPDSADAYVKLGRFLLVNQDYEGSIKALEQALKLDPKNAEAIQIIAEAYDFADQAENAIKMYEEAIKYNPDEKAYPYNLGRLYFKLAMKDGIDENTRNAYLQKCADAFGKVIELDPTMKEPYDFKSNAEITLKKYDEALATLKQAIEHFPDNGTFWFNLGVVYARLNKNDEAKKAFARAKELGVE